MKSHGVDIHIEDNITPNIPIFMDRFKKAIMIITQTEAVKLEAYMKSNRKWTDRTGMAKATLNARASMPSENIARITLAHGVNYGIWLELAHEQNYAILGPTVNTQTPGVLQDFRDFLKKVNM